MFSYVDPSIKTWLLEQDKLFCVTKEGTRCAPDSTSEAPFISMVGPVPLPLPLAHGEETFEWYSWVRNSDLHRIEDAVNTVREQGAKHLFDVLTLHMAVNSILVFGELAKAHRPLVRIHSNCLTGDVFGSKRCDCGPQFREALEQVVQEGVGAVVYMAGHEGRGIGLWAKAVTYLLQDAGYDTYQANQKLGLPNDSRSFFDAGRILKYFLGPKPTIRMLGNNPLKREHLEQSGLTIAEQVPLIKGVNQHNARYLNAKRQHGHTIPKEMLET